MSSLAAFAARNAQRRADYDALFKPRAEPSWAGWADAEMARAAREGKRAAIRGMIRLYVSRPSLIPAEGQEPDAIVREAARRARRILQWLDGYWQRRTAAVNVARDADVRPCERCGAMCAPPLCEDCLWLGDAINRESAHAA